MISRLIELERKYAPEIQQGKGVFSPHGAKDHAPWNLGGDKMGSDRNNYAPAYAEILDGLDPDVIVELGVFKGASMALWCDLYPEARVIGLDIDPSRFCEDELRAAGAFEDNFPVIIQFDAYMDPAEVLLDYTGGVDLFVDDGPHRADAISRAVTEFGPLMNPGGRFVVEDFPAAAPLMAAQWPDAEIRSWGSIHAVWL